MKKQLFIAVTILLLAFGFFAIISSQRSQSIQGENLGGGFLGFRTDISQASIPVDLILPGGPGKDGIPALFDP